MLLNEDHFAELAGDEADADKGTVLDTAEVDAEETYASLDAAAQRGFKS